MTAIANLIRQQSTTTGTGNLSLTNYNGSQTFDAAFGHAGTSFYYFILNQNALEYEWGIGHLSASTTLVRDTVLGGSNGTSAVNFSAGLKDVTNALPAEKQIAIDASPTVTGNWTFAPASGTALKITPASGTVDKGIDLNCTGPSTGSIAGPIYFNHIQAYFNTTVTGAGLNAQVSALQVNLGVGPNYTGVEAYGLSVGCVPTGANATTSDYVGLSCGVYQAYVGSGRLYGGTSAATVDTSGATPVLIGHEFGIAQNNATTSNVPVRYGINIDNYGLYQASGIDTAISIQSGGSVAGAWKYGICFTDVGGTLHPALTTNASLIKSESAMTITHGLDLTNVTFSGNIINCANVQLTGSGILSLGNGTTASGAIVCVAPTAPSIGLQSGTGISGNPNWSLGCSSSLFFLLNVNTGSNAITINPTTNAITTLGTINGATINETGWTSFTPTVTSGSGSITTVTSAGYYRRLFGRTIFCRLRATLTTVGTAGGALTFTLPVAASTTTPNPTGFGRESGTTGKMCIGVLVTSTTFAMYFYDSTSIFTGGNGSIVDATFIYEASS